jgi:hypothetical protein
MVKNFFIYDWDDNIMVMPSVLHLEKKLGTRWVPVNVNSNMYAKIKYNEDIRDLGDVSYEEFHKDSFFLKHLSKAIKEKTFGPSYVTIKETLINGDDFAIVTMQGHSPHIITSGIMMLIFRTFSINEINQMIENVGDISSYLSKQAYFTISSPEFNKKFGMNGNEKSKDKKCLAINYYVTGKMNKLNEKKYDKINIFFSDDDLDNVSAAVDLFKYLKIIYPAADFKIFDTSEKIKKKIII